MNRFKRILSVFLILSVLLSIGGGAAFAEAAADEAPELAVTVTFVSEAAASPASPSDSGASVAGTGAETGSASPAGTGTGASAEAPAGAGAEAGAEAPVAAGQADPVPVGSVSAEPASVGPASVESVPSGSVSAEAADAAPGEASAGVEVPGDAITGEDAEADAADIPSVESVGDEAPAEESSFDGGEPTGESTEVIGSEASETQDVVDEQEPEDGSSGDGEQAPASEPEVTEAESADTTESEAAETEGADTTEPEVTEIEGADTTEPEVTEIGGSDTTADEPVETEDADSSEPEATEAEDSDTAEPESSETEDTDTSESDAVENEDNSEQNTEETSEHDGIVLDGEGEIDILITETLEAEGTPILISESVTPENVSVTVWKIDGSAEGEDGEEHVVLEGEPGEESQVTEDSEALEESIHYIIKVEPSQEDIIELSGTEDSHGYDTATEGTVVTLKINVPKGYKLTGAYNGDGEKVPLEKDADGNYYVVVPRGGGVFLGAVLQKTGSSSGSSDNCDGSWFTVVPEQPKAEDEDEAPLIVFDLNGGTLDGNPGPIEFQAERGQLFTLLDAPVKPYARFIRWAPSVPGITARMPGDVFEVSGSVTFLAIWSGMYGSAGCTEDEEDDGPDVTETVRIHEASDEELNLGSVRVEGDEALGIEIEASCEVDIDRDVTVSGGAQGATGVSVSAGDGSTVSAEVEAGDGMTVTASDGGSATGIQAGASGGGNVELDFEGDVSVKSESGSSTGIKASSGSGSRTTVRVDGSVRSR